MGLWSDRSNAVIRHVLESLPVGATEKECRQALRESYPFGERRHYPYAAWCKCCKEAIEKRFASRRVKPTEVCFTLGKKPVYPHNRLWLDVYCGWCIAYRYKNGCLQCGAMRTALTTVVNDPQFRALAQAANDDSLAVHALLDLCEERLGVRPRCTLGKEKANA